MTYTVTKDTGEDFDYEFSYASEMAETDPADTIATSAWAVTGMTKHDESNTTTTTKVWLNAGTSLKRHTATNTVVTAGGRTWVKTLTVSIVPK